MLYLPSGLRQLGIGRQKTTNEWLPEYTIKVNFLEFILTLYWCYSCFKYLQCPIYSKKAYFLNATGDSIYGFSTTSVSIQLSRCLSVATVMKIAAAGIQPSITFQPSALQWHWRLKPLRMKRYPKYLDTLSSTSFVKFQICETFTTEYPLLIVDLACTYLL
jgi:hypothetical protein